MVALPKHTLIYVIPFQVKYNECVLYPQNKQNNIKSLYYTGRLFIT
jgi:hypothetical protein